MKCCFCWLRRNVIHDILLVSSLSKYLLNNFVKFFVKHSQNKQSFASLAKVIHEHYHITFNLMSRYCPFTILLRSWHAVKYARMWVFSYLHFPIQGKNHRFCHYTGKWWSEKNPCSHIIYAVWSSLAQNCNFIFNIYVFWKILPGIKVEGS